MTLQQSYNTTNRSKKINKFGLSFTQTKLPLLHKNNVKLGLKITVYTNSISNLSCQNKL